MSVERASADGDKHETDLRTQRTDDENGQEIHAEAKQCDERERDSQAKGISYANREEIRAKAKQALKDHNHDLLYSLLQVRCQ